MKNETYYSRFLMKRISEALGDSPALLIHGPRQSGKTTLAKQIAKTRGFAYLTFDDELQKGAAISDPVGYIAELPEKVILDEVQRVPEIFVSLKAAIDSQRTKGRFILTGSTNILLLPKLSDSLAGRMEILRLHPLAQSELEGNKPDFLRRLFSSDFKIERQSERLGKLLAERIARGGYPAALARSSSRRRASWYQDYTATLIQHDIRDLARINALETLPRLLYLVAGHTARLLNVSDLASPFQVSRQSIRSYLTLLSGIFLVDELPAWHSNRLKRLVKTPKLHIGDTGLGCALLGLNAKSLWEERSIYGCMLESFVFQEIRRHASWHKAAVSFYHFRNKDQVEVDIVMLSEGGVAGVEVKAASTVRNEDFKGLRKLKEASSKKFRAGVVLYDGNAVVGFGERLYAIPISYLWRQ